MAITYGANSTTRQFAAVCICTYIGTVGEWYDFTVFSQLSTLLAALFFPVTSAIPAELSYWVIVALGILSRPLGALLFGWVADAYGRRLPLVASIVITMLATIGMGCLPTYQQVGLAAPIVLAVLRLVQGMAVGVQFGCAVVHLYEVAPADRQALYASLLQQAVAPGVVMGMLACFGVTAVCTTDELMVWGWRVPFLLAAIATPVAIWLSFEMQESYEYLSSRRAFLLHRIAAVAAAKVARLCVKRQAKCGLRLSAKEVAAQLQSVAKIVLSPVPSTVMSRARSMSDVEWARVGQQQAVHDSVVSSKMVTQGGALPAATAAAAAAAGPVAEGVENELQFWFQHQQQQQQIAGQTAAAATAGGPDMQFCQEVTQRLEQYRMRYQPPDGQYNMQNEIQDTRLGNYPGPQYNGQYNQQEQQQEMLCNAPGQRPSSRQYRQYEQKLYVKESRAVQALGCESEYISHLELLGGKIKCHCVLVVLLRQCWQRVWLQILLEALPSATFCIFLSWPPSIIQAASNTSSHSTMWAMMTGLGLYTLTAPYSGWIADRGIPKVWALMALALGVGAISIPVMFAVHSGAPVFVMVMVTIMLGFCGAMRGLLASIGPQLYPAGVRATGFGVGHNLAMALWGGGAPFMIKGIGILVQPSALSAGVLLVVLGIITWAAALLLLSIVPDLNSSRSMKKKQELPMAAEAAAAALQSTQ